MQRPNVDTEKATLLVLEWEGYMSVPENGCNYNITKLTAKQAAGCLAWLAGGDVQDAYNSACRMVAKCGPELYEHWRATMMELRGCIVKGES